MHRSAALLLAAPAIVFALAACSSGPTESDATSQSAIRHWPPVAFGPYLTIDSLEEPSNGSAVENMGPVELRPVYVHFTLHNTGTTPLDGYVGGDVLPVSRDLPTAYSDVSTDWRVWQLAPGDEESGVVALTAPRAEIGTSFNVFFYTGEQLVGEFYQQGAPLFSATTHANVAARYTVSLDELNIHRTRAENNDSDFASLYTSYLGSDLGPPTVPVGNIGGGVHMLSNIVTKPFDSVPGMSQAPNVSFLVANEGANTEQEVQTVLNDISSITAGVLSAVMPGYAALWKAGDALTQQLNGFIQSCDGVAAVYDVPTIASVDLEVQTRAADLPGSIALDGDKIGPPYNSPVICGMAPFYEVSWTYHRLRDPSDTLAFSPAAVRVIPGRHVKLSLDAPTGGIEWSLQGNYRSSMIAQDGTFYADPNLTQSDDVVIVAQTGHSVAKAWVNVAPPLWIIYQPPFAN